MVVVVVVVMTVVFVSKVCGADECGSCSTVIEDNLTAFFSSDFAISFAASDLESLLLDEVNKLKSGLNSDQSLLFLGPALIDSRLGSAFIRSLVYLNVQVADVGMVMLMTGSLAENLNEVTCGLAKFCFSCVEDTEEAVAWLTAAAVLVTKRSSLLSPRLAGMLVDEGIPLLKGLSLLSIILTMSLLLLVVLLLTFTMDPVSILADGLLASAWLVFDVADGVVAVVVKLIGLVPGVSLTDLPGGCDLFLKLI